MKERKLCYLIQTRCKAGLQSLVLQGPGARIARLLIMRHIPASSMDEVEGREKKDEERKRAERGMEVQNKFSQILLFNNVSLDNFTTTIERQVLCLLFTAFHSSFLCF